MGWLRAALADGPKGAKEVVKPAKAMRMSVITVRIAKLDLCVRADMGDKRESAWAQNLID